MKTPPPKRNHTLKPGTVLALLGCAVVVAGGLPLALTLAGQPDRSTAVLAAPSTVGQGRAGSSVRFAFLARQTTNRCNLLPAALLAMPGRMRLQGSCCDAMNPTAYRTQVQALRSSAGIAQIPADPYDVSVGQAQRLLSYDASIRLSDPQARTYAEAMRMSRLKGPCCCRCWRWYAFRGLSKYLIADGRWAAMQIAALTEHLEGCGGPSARA